MNPRLNSQHHSRRHRSIRRRLAERSPFRTFGRRIVGRAARERLAGPHREPPRDEGRYAPHEGYNRMSKHDLLLEARPIAKGPRAAKRAGVRQEQCADFHRVGKAGLV